MKTNKSDVKPCASVAELRQQLGLKEGELLTNPAGELADILAIDGDQVVIGVLSRSAPIRVPFHALFKRNPNAG